MLLLSSADFFSNIIFFDGPDLNPMLESLIISEGVNFEKNQQRTKFMQLLPNMLIQMGLNARKTLWELRTAKVQTSLCICVV